MKNISATCPYPETKKFEFIENTIELTPQPNHVILKIHTVGICGSDVHYWAHGRCGPFVMDAPLVLGHETSAVVEAVGSGVTHLVPGDRVAVEPGVPCRFCKQCRGGTYNLCPDVQFLATPPVDGSLCQYIEHAADFCYKMPDHMSFEEGALLEPLSVGVHACKRGGVKAGSHVLITGAGPIGLVCLLAARASGATKIVVTDVMDNRLEVAQSLGADLTINALSQDILEQINAFTDVTHTFECSGAEPGLESISF
eukprot:TRINITY_DN1022_c0_g1_i2.p1 TRINITY_DN1022_c0_g1~~TRINITY_DN1022_c0_g1_i2.p1  ORF type:complete len:278 (+),score=42.67 TRINITY_DN1022_c0_g1_i2:71-835(+)